jgi:hypothetical protein
MKAKALAVTVSAALVLWACSEGGAVSAEGDVLGDGAGLGDNNGVGWDTVFDGFRSDGKPIGSDVAPEPGSFGAPCESNEDCLSGYCIEGPDGLMCTKLCVEDCPTGFECVGTNVGADVVFICVPLIDRSCEPCTSDLQCAGGRCVPFGTAGKFCLTDCQEASCKEGYACQNVQVGSKSQQLCVPNSATCECVEASLGLEKSCKLKTGENTCYGVQFCTENGWGDCNLPLEVCDGKDNDCNDVVDDGMLNPKTGKYESDEHCGVCNNSCKAMNAFKAHGKCDVSGPVPTCVWECENDYFDVNVNPTDGCECEYLGAQDDPDVAGDANCDGMDGVEKDGFFVAKNGDDVNPGTRDLPVLTIQQGISLAFEQAKPAVYVATGVYEESIELMPGVGVYGGYSADFELRDPDLEQTALLGFPATPELPGAVNAFGIQDIPSLLSGFHVFGGDAVEAGGSSYAVYLRDCNGSVRLVSNRIAAGNGRDGTHGADGKDGEDGSDGAGGSAVKYLTSACAQANWTTGGGGGSKVCSGEDVSGGAGGTAVCPDWDESGDQPKSKPFDQSHKAEEWGKSGAGNGSGGGGEPGYDHLIWEAETACTICGVPKSPDGGTFLTGSGEDGKNGKNGDDGGTGNGCATAQGEVVEGLWIPGQGSGGGKGKSGAGGGGGGAGGGVETIGCKGNPTFEYTDIGGSGGGGGSGGCQGDGGEGGKSGGGSFGIFVVATGQVASLPDLEGNLVQTGFGGDGGDGGSGGTGGEGGTGASGGAEGDGNAWCASMGAHGGSGGRGGHGGGGGGGCGGPSFGVYLSGAAAELAAAYVTDNQFDMKGAAGSNGSGGKSMGQSGSDGQAGASGQTNF